MSRLTFKKRGIKESYNFVNKISVLKTSRISKIVLDSKDDKRVIEPDLHNTMAHGHYRLQKHKVLEDISLHERMRMLRMLKNKKLNRKLY